jgi:hypothetical protein
MQAAAVFKRVDCQSCKLHAVAYNGICMLLRYVSALTRAGCLQTAHKLLLLHWIIQAPACCITAAGCCCSG